MARDESLKYLKKFTGKTYVIPHHLLLAPNLQSDLENVESFQTLYKPFPFQSSLPVPVSNPNTKSSEDQCLQYITNKETWKKKIITMKGTYKKISNEKKITELMTTSKTVTIPMYLLNFAKLLRKDPDEYFDSKYNWYYSGKGNLREINIVDKGYLLTSVNNELRCQSEDNKIGEEYKKLYVCNSLDPILETAAGESSTDYLIGLRQRNKINLMRVYNDDDSLKSDFMTSIDSDEVPITSVCLNHLCKDICYSCIDGSVHLEDVDANRSFEIYSKDSDPVLNNWSSVEYINDNSIVFTGGKCIRLLDKRTHRKPDDVILLPSSKNCEKITCSKLSAKEEYGAYLGTSHSLYFCDWRYLKDNCFTAKWTHGFRLAPLHISTVTFDGRELISIGNQINESCMVINSCANNSMSDEFEDNVNCLHESYTPWQPPSIHNTLNKSQLKGMCLDPMTGLNKRFDSSTTGRILVTNDNTIKQYMLNSVGDIFCQTFHNRELNIENNEECERLKIWADAIEQNGFPFVVSSQANMYHSYMAMRSCKKTYVMNRIKPNNKGFMRSRKSWNKSMSDLKGYSDICANELLSVWELYENKGEETMVAPSADTKFTVNSWMKNFDLTVDNVIT